MLLAAAVAAEITKPEEMENLERLEVTVGEVVLELEGQAVVVVLVAFTHPEGRDTAGMVVLVVGTPQPPPIHTRMVGEGALRVLMPMQPVAGLEGEGPDTQAQAEVAGTRAAALVGGVMQVGAVEVGRTLRHQ